MLAVSPIAILSQREATVYLGGMTIVTPIGVLLSGDAMGGDGHFNWTMVGAVVGAGLTIPTLDLGAGPLPGLLLVTTGAILTYHLSADPVYPERTADAVVIAPTLMVDSAQNQTPGLSAAWRW